MGLKRPVTWSTLTWSRTTSNLSSFNFDVGSMKARLKLQRLSGGAVHDMGGAGAQGVELPYDRRVMCQLQNETPGTVATDFDAIMDLVSTKATMTAQDVNGTQWTAPMYLTQVNAKLPNVAIETLTHFTFEMIFTQIEDWTQV